MVTVENNSDVGMWTLNTRGYSGKKSLDKNEMKNVRWFSRENLLNVLLLVAHTT